MDFGNFAVEAGDDALSGADRIRAQLYGSYAEFRAEMGCRDETENFVQEARRAGLRSGQSVLEIGFGEGRFLDWARGYGCDSAGIETNSAYVASAALRGHRVVCGDAASQENLGGQFDFIVAFDVLEHLTLAQLVRTLQAVSRALKPEGVFLARFPNGASPFSNPYQHGDFTHVNVLSPARLTQLEPLVGLKVVSSADAIRVLGIGDRPIWLKWLAVMVRRAIGTVIGLVYYGANIPLDPNVTVKLRRTKRGSAT